MQSEYLAEIETRLGSEQIHILEEGEGENVFVIWHGFDSVNRFFQWKYLLRYGRVVRVGLPGHGPVATKRWSQCRHWTPEHFAEVAAAICGRFSSKVPLTLVGHSTGAVLALFAAIRQPEAVGRLVLVNPLVWSPVKPYVRLLARTWLWRFLATMAIVPAVIRKRRSTQSFLDGLRPIIRDTESFFGNPNTIPYTDTGHGDYRRSSIAALIGTARVCSTCDLRGMLAAAKSSIPSLVIHGEDDPIAPVAQSEWLVRHLVRATLITLSGVGHLSYGEREHDVARAVTDWLDSQPIPQSP